MQKIIEESKEQEKLDKERWESMDKDLCMLCGAYGADKRSLFIQYFYAIHELVPEAIWLKGCLPEEDARQHMYYLLTCKSCRGSLLAHLEDWRNDRIALREQPKDHDGYLLSEDTDGLIPYRKHGLTVFLTPEQYAKEKEE